MLKIYTDEFDSYIRELLASENASHLAFDITVVVYERDEAYAGFRFAIIDEDEYIVSASSTLRGDPYSRSNNRAMKRVIRRAKKLVDA